MGKNIVEKWGNRKKRGVTRGREGAKKGRKGGGKERAKEVSNGGQNNRQKVGNLWEKVNTTGRPKRMRESLEEK